MYSRTIEGCESNMQTPSNAQTHGWRSCRQMLTSERKERNASCSRSTLITTRAPAHSPSHTWLDAPSSMSFRTRRFANWPCRPFNVFTSSAVHCSRPAPSGMNELGVEDAWAGGMRLFMPCGKTPGGWPG